MRNWTTPQSLAIEAAGHDVLVSAAAGSGKTAVLTERLIRRLTERDNPAELSRMLIVTFTRAAAAELRERIGHALDDAIAAEPDRRDLVRQSCNLSGAHIGTIHSFCLSLLRENFAALGIAPTVRVADETEALTMALTIMDKVIDQFYEESEKPSDSMKDKCNTGFLDLADTFVTDRDDKLAADLYDIYAQTQNYSEGIDIIRNSVHALKEGTKTDFFKTCWGKTIKRGLHDELSYYKKIYLEATEYFPGAEDLEKKFSAAFSSDLNFICELEIAEQTGYEETRNVVAGYKKTAIRRTKAEENEKTDFYKAMRIDFGKFIDKAAKKKLSVPQSKISKIMNDAAAICESLFNVMSTFSEQYSAEKTRRGIIDFSDIEHLSLRLLTDEDGHITDIARQTAEEFDEIYIDEYQDINPIQDAIFTSVSKNNRFMVGDIKQSIYGFRGAAPDIFADYRTRFPKLEPQKKSAKITEEEQESGRTIFLSHNFRCDDTIINFTNAVFSEIMQKKFDSSLEYSEDDRLVFAKLYEKNHKPIPARIALISPKWEEQTDASPGENIEERDEKDIMKIKVTPEDAEAEYVAAESERLIRSGRYKPGDIRILLRSGASDVARFASAFSRHGIRFGSAKSIGFFERPHTMLALSLLRCIDNPLHDIPLAAVLKSPLFDFSMDELIALRKDIPPCASFSNSEFCENACIRGEQSNGIFQNPAAPGKTETVEDETKSKITLYDRLCAYTEKYGFSKGIFFLDTLKDFRARAASLPTDKLIWYLYNHTPILYCGETEKSDQTYSSSASERHDDLLRLYEYARKFETNAFRGLNTFITSIDDLLSRDPHFSFTSLSETPEDAVCVMTIHSSKGLEFPVCFICGTAKKFNKKDSSQLYLLHSELGVCTKLRLKEGFARINTPMRAAVVQKTEEQAIDEELRVLYVAMTRAKEVLYITAGTAKPDTILHDAETCAKYPSHFSLAKNACYMKWVLSAFAAENGKLAVCSERMDGQINCGIIKDKSSGCTCAEASVIRYRSERGAAVFDTDTQITFSDSEKILQKKIDSEASNLSGADYTEYDSMNTDEIYSVLAKRFSEKYSHDYGARLPAKLSVSELHPGFLDDTQALSPEEARRYAEGKPSPSSDSISGNFKENYLSEPSEKSSVTTKINEKKLRLPRFLETGETETRGTERGTATHVFLQFADWENIKKSGIQGELERMIKKGFMTEAMIKLISPDMLETFFGSSLFKELCSAKQIYRELRFNVLLPASGFTENPERQKLLKNEKLLVQGIIDCLYITSSGKLRLLDYKTDYVHGEKDEISETLKKRYKSQLKSYKLAAEIITCTEVDKCIIYSLTSGLGVEV